MRYPVPRPCPAAPSGPRLPRTGAARGGASLLALLVLPLWLGAGRPAEAVVCSLDAAPAATLLLPYFEVNLNDPNGLTTLFSVSNASATAALTRVTIWSDLAVPVLGFNLYLTGYDVQTVNLRDILVSGNLPQTASYGQDPNGTISPKGIYSQNINFQSCHGILPPQQLQPAMIQHLQLALTGSASPLLGNLCAGQQLGDHVARGYVTVDTVSACGLLSPADPGYFGPGGTGYATDQNMLWGTWFIANSQQSYLIGSNMIGLEADPKDPATTTPGRYTFYGRYVGWSAADNREPLASTFAAQYFGGGELFSAGTSLIVWRDPKVAQQPFPCQARFSNPAWYPLLQEGLVIFNESENVVQMPLTPVVCPPCPPLIPFPAATQRVQVNGAALATPFPFGWLMIDLNTPVPPAGANPPFDPQATQGYVISAHLSNGHAAAVDAYRLDSSCAPNHSVP